MYKHCMYKKYQANDQADDQKKKKVLKSKKKKIF